MATCHRGTGQPLDKDTAKHGQDTDILQDYHHEDMDNFENTEQENHTNLAILTWDLDDLCHRVQADKGQPTEALNPIEHELQRLSIALHPSALPEPLDDVLQQYTETLSSAQKQTGLCEYTNSGYTYLQW